MEKSGVHSHMQAATLAPCSLEYQETTHFFAVSFEIQSNRFSQTSASGNSENVPAWKPRFEATNAPNPFMVGGGPTIAIFGVPDKPRNQCCASVCPNSYRSKLDSSPLSDKQSTKTLSKPL